MHHTKSSIRLEHLHWPGTGTTAYTSSQLQLLPMDTGELCLSICLWLVWTQLVTDALYSFCNLTSTFAVEVYGATATSYIGYVFLVLTCGVGVAVLLGSFFYYRYLLKSVKHNKSD